MMSAQEQQLLRAEPDAGANGSDWTEMKLPGDSAPIDFGFDSGTGNDAPTLPKVDLDRQSPVTWSDTQMYRAYVQQYARDFFEKMRQINAGALPGVGMPVGPDAANYYDQKMFGTFMPVTGLGAAVNLKDGQGC